LVFVRVLTLRDVRNLEEQTVELDPGLNLFVGPNAQGKTSLLEALGLLARGRSFRTDDLGEVALRGRREFEVRGVAARLDRETALGFQWTAEDRTFSVDHHKTTARDYHGRLEASVYSTDRLRVVHGPMRERRLFFDRAAASLSVAYRQDLRDYDRILRQRNAALESPRGDKRAWDERLVEVGGRLRARRHQYLSRINQALRTGYRPQGEGYEVLAEPLRAAEWTEERHQAHLGEEVEREAGRERGARRSLVGPHRDPIQLRVDAVDARTASSGQVRSLLLALTLATLRVYREQAAETAVALLDDLDSELDADRAAAVCRAMAEEGQVLVTTAHPEWGARLAGTGRHFRVCAGRVTVS
jgi:DNA replication and repair protein RecF